MDLFRINHRSHPYRSLAVVTALVMIGAVVMGGVPPATAQIDDDDDGYPYSGSYTYPSSSRMPDLNRRYTGIERSARRMMRDHRGDDLAGALIEGAIGLFGRGIHRRMGGEDAPVRLVPHLPPSGKPRSDRGFRRERPFSGGDAFPARWGIYRDGNRGGVRSEDLQRSSGSRSGRGSASARCWRHPQLRRLDRRTPAGDRFTPGVRAPRLEPATGSESAPRSEPSLESALRRAGSNRDQAGQRGDQADPRRNQAVQAGRAFQGTWTCALVPPGAEASEALKPPRR